MKTKRMRCGNAGRGAAIGVVHAGLAGLMVAACVLLSTSSGRADDPFKKMGQALGAAMGQQGYYNLGKQQGKTDKKNGVPSNYACHKKDYDSRFEEFFKKGYADGYGVSNAGSNAGGGAMDANQQGYYDDGKNRGEFDRKTGKTLDHTRYPNDYDSRFEPYFKKGYADGYGAAGAGNGANSNGMDGNQQGYYDDGKMKGMADKKAGKPRDYTRYAGDYDSRFEPFFKSGYADGFYVAKVDSGSNDAGMAYYNDGKNRGEADKKAGKNRDYARYASDYDRDSEPFFKSGYLDGYAAAQTGSAPPSSGMDGNQQGYYDDGKKKGAADKKAGRSSDHTRYAGDYDTRFEPFFKSGYTDGYYAARAPGGSNGKVSEADMKDYYKEGYMVGREDRASNQSNDYGRHWQSDPNDVRFEPYYRAGFDDGWNKRASKY